MSSTERIGTSVDPDGEKTRVLRFSCRTCGVGFVSSAAHKEHHHSDWHAYNLRRRLHELPPVSLEEFSRKLQLALLALKLKEAAAHGNPEAVEAAAAAAISDPTYHTHRPPVLAQFLSQQQQQQQEVFQLQNTEEEEERSKDNRKDKNNIANIMTDEKIGHEQTGDSTTRGPFAGKKVEKHATHNRETTAVIAAAASALIGLKVKRRDHLKGGKRGDGGGGDHGGAIGTGGGLLILSREEQEQEGEDEGKAGVKNTTRKEEETTTTAGVVGGGGATAHNFGRSIPDSRMRGESHTKKKEVDTNINHILQHNQSKGAAHACSATDINGEAVSAEAKQEAMQQAEAVAAVAATARNIILQHKPECVSLFDNHPPFRTYQQNLQYMKEAYSFVPPDEEYITDYPLFFRIIWQQQRRRPRCLLCGRRFSGVTAAQQHMQQKGHTQLHWERDPEEQTRLQQKLVSLCYDYRQSYIQLLEKRLEEKGQLQDGKIAALPQPQHHQLPSSVSAEDSEEEDSSEWEDASDDEEEEIDEAVVVARGRSHTRKAAAHSAISLDNLSQEELEELLIQQLINRHVAYVYKQRRRAARLGVGGLRAEAEALVLEDMQGLPPSAFSPLSARGRRLRGYASAASAGSTHVALSQQQLQTKLTVPYSRGLFTNSRQYQLAAHPGMWNYMQRPAASLAERKRRTRRQQVSFVRLGVKQNKLQKHMRLEHKYFF